jgi:hypothetical protein
VSEVRKDRLLTRHKSGLLRVNVLECTATDSFQVDVSPVDNSGSSSTGVRARPPLREVSTGCSQAPSGNPRVDVVPGHDYRLFSTGLLVFRSSPGVLLARRLVDPMRCRAATVKESLLTQPLRL